MLKSSEKHDFQIYSEDDNYHFLRSLNEFQLYSEEYIKEGLRNFIQTSAVNTNQG